MYPIFLLMLEWFLRIAFQLDTEEFIGPTLAATSIGLVIPLVTFRSSKGLTDENGDELSPELLEQIRRLEESGASVASGESTIFANICFVISLMFTLGWVATIVIEANTPSSVFFLGLSPSYLIGLSCFLVGLFLSEIKEFL